MKPIRRIIMMVMAFFLITGCWNQMELNELAIVMAVGIDQHEDGYLLTVQILNPDEAGGDEGEAGAYDTPVTTYETENDTIFEAWRQLHTKVPRRMYIGELEVMVIGETLAEEGMGNMLDFFLRDHEVRLDPMIVIGNGMMEASNILKTLTPVDIIPATKMVQSLEASEEAWGTARAITLFELANELRSEGKETVVSGIKLQEGDTEQVRTTENVEAIDSLDKLRYEGLAVFQNDELIGWLNEEESKGYTYSQGELTSTIINVPCPDGGELGLEQIRMNEDTKSTVQQGNPHIEINMGVEANVGNAECTIDLSQPETIEQLEVEAEKVIEGQMQAAIEKAQTEYESDIFGFGDVVYRSHPNEWKQLEDNWTEHFRELPVTLNVDVRILQTGGNENPVSNELEE